MTLRHDTSLLPFSPLLPHELLALNSSASKTYDEAYQWAPQRERYPSVTDWLEAMRHHGKNDPIYGNALRRAMNAERGVLIRMGGTPL